MVVHFIIMDHVFHFIVQSTCSMFVKHILFVCPLFFRAWQSESVVVQTCTDNKLPTGSETLTNICRSIGQNCPLILAGDDGFLFRIYYNKIVLLSEIEPLISYN